MNVNRIGSIRNLALVLALGLAPGALAQDNAAAIAAAENMAAIRNFAPKDPWRVIDGVTNAAKSAGWKVFHGQVRQVEGTTVRVHGYCDSEDSPMGVPSRSDAYDFFVLNFPYQVVEDQKFSVEDGWMAKDAGTETYRTVLGASRTLRALDYGRPVTVLPHVTTPSELAAAKAEAENRRAAARAASKASELKYYQDRAAEGVASAQFVMGQRYLTGDGVSKDAALARTLLEASASKGYSEAVALLKTLPAK